MSPSGDVTCRRRFREPSEFRMIKESVPVVIYRSLPIMKLYLLPEKAWPLILASIWVYVLQTFSFSPLLKMSCFFDIYLNMFYATTNNCFKNLRFLVSSDFQSEVKFKLEPYFQEVSRPTDNTLNHLILRSHLISLGENRGRCLKVWKSVFEINRYRWTLQTSFCSHPRYPMV